MGCSRYCTILLRIRETAREIDPTKKNMVAEGPHESYTPWEQHITASSSNVQVINYTPAVIAALIFHGIPKSVHRGKVPYTVL